MQAPKIAVNYKYPDYFVRDDGTLWRIRNNRFVIKSPIQIQPTRHRRFQIYSLDGVRHSIGCKKIVWEAFNGPVPEGFIVSSKNGVFTDYMLSNLFLTTREEIVKRTLIKYKKRAVVRLSDGKLYSSAIQAAKDNFYSKSGMHSHITKIKKSFMYESECFDYKDV